MRDKRYFAEESRVPRDRPPLSFSLEAARRRAADLSMIRVDVMKARMHHEQDRRTQRKRERERAYLLNGGRLQSGDNIVVAPTGDHGHGGGGSVARGKLHPASAYHRRRSRSSP